MSANRAFFSFGVAALLPWNCLLSSMGFLDLSVFKGLGWTLVLTPLYMTSSLLTQLLLLFVGYKVPTKLMLSVSLSLGLVGALMLLFLCSITARDMMDNTVRFQCTLCTCLGLGIVSNGMLQSSAGMLATVLMPEHGSLPAMYSNGMAVAGVLSFVVSLGVTAAAGGGYSIDALFAVLALTFVVSLFDFVRIARNGLVRDIQKNRLDTNALTRLNLETASAGSGSPQAFGGLASPGSPSRLSRAISRSSVVSGTLRREWEQQLNLFINYAQTFLVFPVVSSKWNCSGDWVAAETYGLIIVSVFQLGDLTGRLFCSCPSFVERCPSGDKLWVVVMARTVFLPFFFLSWRVPSGLAWLFGSSAFHIGLMIVFSLTNGALTSLAFLRGSAGTQAEDRDIVGRALPLAISIGIVAGSACSSCAVVLLGAHN